MKTSEKVKLICNECGKKRYVSAEGNYNDRCPICGGVDWDVDEFSAAPIAPSQVR
jgi:rubrerythrin